MSLIDNSDNLSIAPLLVLTTVPVGAGALGRGPLGPLVAGRPPTRNGSLRIDRARPPTMVAHPATTKITARQAIAARTDAIARRLRPRLIISPTPSRPACKESHLRWVGRRSVDKRSGAQQKPWTCPGPAAKH